MLRIQSKKDVFLDNHDKLYVEKLIYLTTLCFHLFLLMVPCSDLSSQAFDILYFDWTTFILSSIWKNVFYLSTYFYFFSIALKAIKDINWFFFV